MEMCIDNPRSGFSDLFSTHPSVDARVYKLVHLAGGHDPGPIALPPLDEEDHGDEAGPETPPQIRDGRPNPWGAPPPSPRGPWG
jgi:heat shock protein HtpX